MLPWPRNRFGDRAPSSSRHGAAIIALIALLLAPGLSAKAADFSEDIPLAGGALLGWRSDRVLLGLGAFNVIRNEEKGEIGYADMAFEARAEYQVGKKLYSVGPLFGILVNSDGGLFGYGALYTEWAYGDWRFTPSFGVGGYDRNGSKELGGVFQFYIHVEAAYEFADRSRLGVRLAHISNAGIQEYNTGEESALVTYSIPIDF